MTSGYTKPYRLDIIIYVREDILSKELKKHNFIKNIEGLFVEVNLRKMKFLFFGTYHSTHPEYGLNDTDYFEQVCLALDVYNNYEKFLLSGDFNVEEGESCYIWLRKIRVLRVLTILAVLIFFLLIPIEIFKTLPE